jgi:hypothetical protein
MKYVSYAILLLQAWVLPVNAQSVFLTPCAGMNLSTITQAGGSVRSGLNFGISGEYVFASRLAAATGLYYSMQGTKFEDISPEHDYLQIPLFLKYYATKDAPGGDKGFNLFAGPQLDIKAMVNQVPYAKEYRKENMGESYMLFDMTRPFGLSAVIGAGYLFDNGLTLSANLNFGLTNKVKERYTGAGSYKDFVAQIKFGYRFALR